MYDIGSLMIGKCEKCGLENVELMSIRMGIHRISGIYAINVDQQTAHMHIDC